MHPRRYFADQYEGDGDPDLASYARAGHVLYAHKATEGAYHADAKHRERVAQAHAQGLIVLHYHFCRPEEGVTVAREMNFFWERVRTQLYPEDKLALDLERAKPGHGPVTSDYIVGAWSHLLAISDHDARIYGSTSFLEVMVDRRWLAKRARWQAAYGPRPGRSPWGSAWWAWQSSDGVQGPEPHRLEGIPSGDISVLRLGPALRAQYVVRRRRQRAQQRVRKGR